MLSLREEEKASGVITIAREGENYTSFLCQCPAATTTISYLLAVQWMAVKITIKRGHTKAKENDAYLLFRWLNILMGKHFLF